MAKIQPLLQGTDGDVTTYAVNVSNDAIKGAVQPELNKRPILMLLT